MESEVENISKQLTDLQKSLKYELASYEAVRDAAVRFVLSNPDVSCACMTIKNFIDLDFYTGSRANYSLFSFITLRSA